MKTYIYSFLSGVAYFIVFFLVTSAFYTINLDSLSSLFSLLLIGLVSSIVIAGSFILSIRSKKSLPRKKLLLILVANAAGFVISMLLLLNTLTSTSLVPQ